jgi:hypothetical protein
MADRNSIAHRCRWLSLLWVLGLAGGCNATDDRPPVWEYISPVIFQPNCATTSCHSRAAAVAGLDFSDPDRGYTSLTGLWVWIVDPGGTIDNGCKPMEGTVVCQRSRRPLVNPYNPAQSRVVNMLRARSASRMPPDRPLSEADIRLVEQWILDGAYKSVPGPGSADAGRPDADGGSDVGDAATPQDGNQDGNSDGSDGRS